MDAESASEITLSSATLKADIYPNFQQTKYGFEYTTSEAALEEGHGTKVFGASELQANEEPPSPALCADGTQPTLSEGTFTCDDGSQPKCQDGAVLTDRENSLVCFDPVSANISGLEEHTTYYYRAIAENASSENRASPNKSKPIIATSAVSEGEIDPEVSHEHFFEYGASLCEVTAETCGTVATRAQLDRCSAAKNRSKSSVPLEDLRSEHDLSLLGCRCERRSGVEHGAETDVHDAWLPGGRHLTGILIAPAVHPPVEVRHIMRPVSEATSVQKLVRAVKLCQKKPKRKRAACLHMAKKKYGLEETEMWKRK